MSGEQKLKDGDEVLFTCESTNSVELLFFTNHRQVYKSHAYDFNDSKASVLGDYVASALGMEEGEVPLYMVVTPDYKGWMLFFYDNGKCAKVPLSSYETKQNRRKLLKAYSDKAELAFMRHLPEETELAIFTTQNFQNLLTSSELCAKIFQQSFRWLLRPDRMPGAGSRNSEIVMSTYIEYGSFYHDRERGEINHEAGHPSELCGLHHHLCLRQRDPHP